MGDHVDLVENHPPMEQQCSVGVITRSSGISKFEKIPRRNYMCTWLKKKKKKKM